MLFLFNLVSIFEIEHKQPPRVLIASLARHCELLLLLNCCIPVVAMNITAYYLSLGWFLLLLAMPKGIIVHVNENGEDSSDCLLADTSELKQNNACKSLDFVASNFGIGSNGLTIVLETDLQMNGLVNFTNCSSLTITSKDVEMGVVLTANHTTCQCGFSFTDIHNLTLSGLVMTQCEHWPPEHLISMNRSVAVHVHQGTGLAIRFFMVSQVPGTGLLISDTGGQVLIEESTFSENSAPEDNISSNNVFAGGIHMQFANREMKGNIIVKNCTFERNMQPTSISLDPVHQNLSDYQTLYGYGTGGGMGILFLEDAEGVDITIENCKFTNNTANLGAGLYIHFMDDTKANTLTVSDSEFHNNTANAGGGLCVGLARLSRGEGFNRVFVVNTWFMENTARYGGGTSVFAIHSMYFPEHREDVMHFSNCTWERNNAHYSSAIDLSALQQDHFNFGFLPVPKFSQCRFVSNQLTNIKHGTKYRYSGVFAITSFEAQFKGTNHFVGNSYTALQLTSATVLLEEGTVMIFDSNEGTRGAAIAMYGFSSLKGNDDCVLEFKNNSAHRVGGGIYYQPFDQREIFGGRSCFIKYVGNTENPHERNYTFIFSNNTAALGGASIFAVSFHSCYFQYHGSLDNHNLSSFFEKIGTFQFDNHFDDNGIALATEGNKFVLDKSFNHTFSAIPGELLHIPIVVLDEFSRATQTQIGLEVHSSLKPAAAGDTLFYYFTHSRTRVYGTPGEVKKLVFNTLNTRDAYYDNITVNLTGCPPGYIYVKNNHTCTCSADNTRTSYHGISKCNATQYRAHISRDYWAGYHKDVLYTGPCAFKLCQINSDPSHHHLLPNTTSIKALNDMMCGGSKTGMLCGQCGSGYSAYFHSDAQRCGPNSKKCSFGSLLYFLSEVVPLVLLFTLIVHFDISFTAGGISGLVFFSQMILAMPIDVEKILYHQDDTTVQMFKVVQYGYTLIYSVLNLNFFSIDTFSFCLWQSANPMDTLAFNFVTTSLALILVWVLVRAMNSSWYMKWNKKKQPRSVVHGLSAFLVLSFSQCITVCFQILSQNVIRSNEQQVHKRHIAVTHYGGLPYMGSDHLPFAIVSIFFLIFIGLIPPLFLLLNPLLLQILSLCKLSEHRITTALLKTVHIHRLTPLFDSFQSCYKDKLRFFAGLYFVYKIGILFFRSYTNDLTTLLASLEGIIFVVLGVHAIVQPYKERCHNIIDSCLFFNLGFINGINIYTNVLSIGYKPSYKNQIIGFSALQMVLIYVPIIGTFVWCIRKLMKKRKHRHYQVLDSFPNVQLQEDEDRNATTD